MTAPNTQTSYISKLIGDFNPDGLFYACNASIPANYAAGNQTLLAADLVGGMIKQIAANNSTPALTTDTGANVAALLPGGVNAQNGTAFWFTIVNLGLGNGTQTLTAGTGWTLVGNATVPIATSGTWRAVYNGNSTFTAIRE